MLNIWGSSTVSLYCGYTVLPSQSYSCTCRALCHWVECPERKLLRFCWMSLSLLTLNSNRGRKGSRSLIEVRLRWTEMQCWWVVIISMSLIADIFSFLSFGRCACLSAWTISIPHLKDKHLSKIIQYAVVPVSFTNLQSQTKTWKNSHMMRMAYVMIWWTGYPCCLVYVLIISHTPLLN